MKKSSNKLLSVILVATIAFGVFCSPNVVSFAASNYNAQAAVQYGKEHWNDGVGAGATFVSNCLKAGGCTASHSVVSNLRKKLLEGNWGTEYLLTKNGYYIYSSENKGKVSAGDPIFFYCTSCSAYAQVVLASGVSSSGRIMAYAHNAAWNNKETLGGFYDASGHTGSQIRVYSIHMNTHSHSYGTNFEAAHPHREYKKCSCGDWYYTGNNRYYTACSICRPGKATFTNSTRTFEDKSDFTITWTATPNTSHYTTWLAVYNPETDRYEENSLVVYRTNSMTLSLPVGKYQLRLCSYDDSHWEDNHSDWVHTQADYFYFEVVEHIHKYDSTVTKAATCTANGEITNRCTYSGCDASETLPLAKLPHTLVTIPGKAATCTATGKTDGKKCTVCGAVTVAQKTIAKKAHKETTLKAKVATCTATGLTAGKKCSVCGTVTKAQTTIAKKAHSYKTTTLKATLSKDGKVKKVCSACKKTTTSAVKKVKSIKLNKTDLTYNGKAQTVTVTVKDSAGKALKLNTDYTVSGNKNTKSNQYKVTVTLKGKYSGTKKLTYYIRPTKATISSVAAGKKSLTVKWKSVSANNGDHYYIQYSTSKDFKTDVKSLNGCVRATLGSWKITGLKTGKTYYVRLCTAKNVGTSSNPQFLYSKSWSDAKGVKVK